MSLAVLALQSIYSSRSFTVVFKNISLTFFCSMKPRKRKMNIPQKWLNIGHKSIGYDSNLMRNIVKTTWIRIPNLTLPPRVQHAMPRAFEISLVLSNLEELMTKNDRSYERGNSEPSHKHVPSDGIRLLTCYENQRYYPSKDV